MRYLIILLLFSISCKSQQVSTGAIASDYDGRNYVEWYNSTVKKPIFDTVGVYKPPLFSDIRYVIVRPIEGDVLEIAKRSGTTIGFICAECIWRDEITINSKGEVVGGLTDVVIKGGKMVVQYERCEGCIFRPNLKGDL